MPQREVKGIPGKTTCRSSLVITLRTLTTHLLPPVVTARSQHQGAAQEVPFCLAVCTEAQSSVVELKVDIHKEVSTALQVRHPLLHFLECSSRCHVQATKMSEIKLKPLILRDRPPEGGRQHLSW